MARGRRPDAPAVKEAKGTKARTAPVTDSAAVLRSTMPRTLSAAAKKVWEVLAPELTRMKFLRETDRDAFSRYCEHAARWWKLTRELRREGDTYWTESAHGKMQRLNPKFIVRERIENRLEALEDRFGLNPAARQQILQRLSALPPPAPPAGDMFAQPGETAENGAPPPKSGSPIGLLRSNVH
jgi:P27 family predicted phage terminase small subunit